MNLTSHGIKTVQRVSNTQFRNSIIMKLSYLREIATSILTASFVLTSTFIFAGSASAQNSKVSNAAYIKLWTDSLKGQKLVRLETGTYDTLRQTTSLCSNGQYFYSSSGLGVVTVPNGGASVGGTEQSQGLWKVVDAAGPSVDGIAPNDLLIQGESLQELVELGFKVALLEYTTKDATLKTLHYLVYNPNVDGFFLNGNRVYIDSKDKICS